MKEKLNIRFLVQLLVVAIIASGGWFFLHRYQLKRNPAALLDMATVAESEGKTDRAARFVGLYLNVAGGDSEARIRYANLLEQQPTTRNSVYKVMQVREQLLLDKPENHAIRRQVVTAGLKLGLYDDTLRHVNYLLKAFPNDGTIHYQLGLCLQGRGEDEKAANAFVAAVDKTPSLIEAYDRLARLYRNRLNESKNADDALEKMIKNNPSSFQAYLIRANSRETVALKNADNALLKDAEKDLQEARRLAPDDADVLLASEKAARDKGNMEKARGYLKHATDKHPKDRRVFTLWAIHESLGGRELEALKWLRQGVKEFPDDPSLLFNLASSLIQSGKLAEGEEILAEMDRLKLVPAQIDLLRARILMAEQKWTEASLLLEKTRPLLAETPDLAIRSHLFLAECYEHLGDVDRQIAVLKQATTADQTNPLARSQYADALSKLGRFDEALEQYRRVMGSGQKADGSWTKVASLELRRNLNRSRDQQQWPPFDNAIKQAEKQSPGSIQVPLLRAEALRAQRRTGEAKELLEKTRDQFPKALEPWVALAGLEDSEGHSAEAFVLLNTAEKRLKVTALPGNPEVNASRLQELASAYMRMGKDADASRLVKQIVQLQPLDLKARLPLFDLALRAGNLEEMKKAIEGIKRLEGPGGALGNYDSARLLLWQAQKGDKAAIGQARALLVQVAARRPTWSKVPLVEGELDELEGKRDKSLENYLKAIELGERQPNLIRQVTELLCTNHRYAEADQVVRKLLDGAFVSADLQMLGADLSYLAADKKRALSLAQQAVPPDSKNYRDHIWLGHLLWAVDKKVDAEAAFIKATELADTEPDAWIALIQFYMASDKKQQAKAALNKAKLKLTTERTAIGLAQCNKAYGQEDQALELVGRAAASKTADATVLRGAAEYYLKLDKGAEAIPLLRRLLEEKNASPQDKIWSRRTLALALAAQGSIRDFPKSVELLDTNLKANASNPDDLFAKARVLATKASDRPKAVGIMESLSQKQPLSAPQQFFLARLYDLDQNVAGTRKAMLSALTAEGDNPSYLEYYAGFLLRHKDLQEARTWIEKLQQVQPHSFEAVSLYSQLVALQSKSPSLSESERQKQLSDVVTRVLDYVDKQDSLPNDPSDRRRRAAGLLDGLSQTVQECKTTFVPAAEKLYRQWAAESKQPESVLILADFLGRQNQTAETLALCERALKTCAPDLVLSTSLRALETLPSTDPRLAKVEQWLNEAILKRPDLNVPLVVLLAQLRERQGRIADAKELYGKVIQKDPSNLVALNNLAFILALEGDKSGHGQALKLVTQAIAIAGPIGPVLDTRATVYLALGKNDLALKDLLDALAQAPTPASYYHLAVAYQRSNQPEDALKALEKAKDLGLRPDRLHFLERDGYSKMRVELTRK
jgi:tetratricopeptide (TPR) repeat protein